MNENRFWAMIEAAWDTVGGRTEDRQRLAAGQLTQGEAYALQAVLEPSVVVALRAELGNLSAEDLLAFDRILERKMYDIDRADIHQRTDGSDDGFLYCRGFIVGMGKAYYEAVSADPDKAIELAECEAICYASYGIYWERFGEPPPSGISRETASNFDGWPENM